MAIHRIRVEQVRSQDPEQSSLAEQLNGIGKPYYEFVTPQSGQKDIPVGKPYQPGDGELLVFLNGQKAVPTVDPVLFNGDYVEFDQNTIRFLEPLVDGDIVELRMAGKGQGVAYVVDHFHAYREKPIGVIDGVNKIFFLSRTPRDNTELVFLNGILRDRGEEEDYVIEGNKITMVEAPPINAKILVNYDLLYVNA
ncbi:hypothetical protein PUW25_26445 (plasmid) [Paenibacillus urinalis]|uniref:Uncharacterized protein n=1 Tax=Paenibacillus urinalis TaxID=521520 RepID=A0ABY7XHN4_9BACL|nr:hypothetical protein [Paenibacillus urinalis]WDI05113.1 hypothetical protein PUW25_26445 [Paenibacillus urinalis]